MKKKLLFLLSHGNLNYGKAVEVAQKAGNSSTITDQREFKLGLQMGFTTWFKIQMGAFGEYKWNERLGLRSGILLSCTAAAIEGIYAAPSLAYVTIPILAMHYLGSTRQFCLFYGGEVGCLVSQKGIPIEAGKLRKVQMGIKAGFDHEFPCGFIVGISLTKYLLDVVAKGQPYDNWRLHGGRGWGIHLMPIGINFVKLFNKLSNGRSLPVRDAT